MPVEHRIYRIIQVMQCTSTALLAFGNWQQWSAELHLMLSCMLFCRLFDLCVLSQNENGERIWCIDYRFMPLHCGQTMPAGTLPTFHNVPLCVTLRFSRAFVFPFLLCCPSIVRLFYIKPGLIFSFAMLVLSPVGNHIREAGLHCRNLLVVFLKSMTMFWLTMWWCAATFV